MSYPITGVGAVASIGGDPQEIFEALCAGRSGIGPLGGFDRSRYKAQQLFEIDDRPAGGDEPHRATRLLVRAVRQALRDAGLPEDLGDTPVLIGTGLRELRSLELWWRDGVPFGADELDFGPALHREFGATDTHTFANACSASLYALALGWDLLAQGDADTVVVAGCDVVTESMFGQADRIQLTPPTAVRPFDRDRQGTILGEGAAAVVLRRHPDRDRPVRGLLHSVAVNCDAHHTTAPDPAGVGASVRQAHAAAGIGPQDLDLVLLHATGTPLNDRTEAEVLGEVFAGAAPAMTGLKGLTGHTSGSAALLSLVVALSAIENGRIPHMAGLEDPLPEGAGLRLVTGAPLTAPVGLAQVNGFGFGGVNAVAIVGGAA
ncbi:beta-ketoacyl-[acyl-carrier-protein] synthase family protein [Kitasatospora sp. NPDC101183]|uniref:beta-ketoacyl-[acyl-carrier-protein] synthase family protein n=1 Tax=Kitasatospora sp. NPDC101183 TaxID=3364100 RepID=UPI00382B8987